MQIFNSQQIRAWDEYTMAHEPVSSADLMERAALACFKWLLENGFRNRTFSVFCGKGNNGGDGLALARMLAASGLSVTVLILEFGHKGTDDFQLNLARLHETSVVIKFIPAEENIPEIPKNDIVIDALLGSGLNRELEGLTARLVKHINSSGNTVIAIDIPTGLYLDKSSVKNTVIHAAHTLSFQSKKLAFLMQENEIFLGELHILDIGLHKDFCEKETSTHWMIDHSMVKNIIVPRKRFSHKGDYGHAAIVAGSRGMMGAAVLAARACIHSGVGKLTCHIPDAGNDIMQIAVPEAMCSSRDDLDLRKYDTLGIGPGLGQDKSNKSLLEKIFSGFRLPVVIDADGLNTIANNQELLQKVPGNSVLTPHSREFERLFGETSDEFARIDCAIANAKKSGVVIVLKGPYTCVAAPSGTAYFNETGNPGMATGGTGDVLTGIITGLLAQKIEPVNAAIAGVYLHGLAGDIAAKIHSQQALSATDLITHLGDAFIQMI